MPNLATFREQGYPDMDIYIWAGVLAPPATPDAVIARLNTEFVKALKQQEIRDQWYPVGSSRCPPRRRSSSKFAQAESKDRWAEAVKISGFKACRARSAQKLQVPGNTPDAAAWVLIGQVVGIHIDDTALTADGRIDIARLRPLARLGYRDYTDINHSFEMSEMTGRPAASISHLHEKTGA
jgi:flavin reductase (DIM6/NTAB) family NADH-FMN oxidoreductase RutF